MGRAQTEESEDQNIRRLTLAARCASMDPSRARLAEELSRAVLCARTIYYLRAPARDGERRPEAARGERATGVRDELAESSGVSKGAIHRVEQGGLRGPSDSAAQSPRKIAKILVVDPKELVRKEA